MSNLEVLRDTIRHLSYVEMMTLAEWFANIELENVAVHDASYWAFVFNDWAQNVELPEDDVDE